MRVARQLAGLIALGEERERRIREQVNAEALLRSDELKTALLRAVSHDLRSPLQAISAASGGLRFAALDDDEQELLDTIGAESSRMSRMIENLLDLLAPERRRAAARRRLARSARAGRGGRRRALPRRAEPGSASRPPPTCHWCAATARSSSASS